MSDTDRVPTAEADDGLIVQLRAMARGTLVERLGIELVEASAERVVGTMPVAGNTQPLGLLHGGATVALAETLGSYAASLHAGPGRSAVGIEVSATHHRGVRDGVVTGRATAVHLGGTTASYEIVVEDETSRRICTARLTCLLMTDRGESQSPATSDRPTAAGTGTGAGATAAADPAAASLD